MKPKVLLVLLCFALFAPATTSIVGGCIFGTAFSIQQVPLNINDTGVLIQPSPTIVARTTVNHDTNNDNDNNLSSVASYLL